MVSHCPYPLLTAAIGICFSMTTVFRSDVLANAMQRIVDQAAPLPVCFVRTVIQAVTTYKSLVPFVANSVLPKLVVKRVWEMPQLWEGFVRLVRVLGRASFGALLQMPLEQIREVVEKQPTLKAPLKTFLANKPAARNQLASVGSASSLCADPSDFRRRPSPGCGACRRDCYGGVILHTSDISSDIAHACCMAFAVGAARDERCTGSQWECPFFKVQVVSARMWQIRTESSEAMSRLLA